MCYDETVWLSTEDIRRKYLNLFEERKFTEPFIAQLFDAHLLRGYYDRKKRQVFILEKSWLDLLVHMNYNLFLLMQPVNGQVVKFSVPAYCNNITTQIRYDFEKNWFTPTELLDQFERLRTENVFTERFITQLVKTGILRGKYDDSIKATYVLLASFVELLFYRNDTIKKNLISPEDDLE